MVCIVLGVCVSMIRYGLEVRKKSPYYAVCKQQNIKSKGQNYQQCSSLGAVFRKFGLEVIVQT